MYNLNKQADDLTIKSYFEGVHELLKSKGSDAFCVNLDEVWSLVYERKDHVVRALIKDYFEGVDYIIKTDDTFPINGELENQSVTDGWKVRRDYYLTVSCLEHLIARKERRVFEVYRQVFHQAMEYSKLPDTELKQLVDTKLLFINAVSEGLRLNDTSRLALYNQVNDQHGLGLSLPAYVPAKGVLKSLTDCLSHVGSDIKAKDFNLILAENGYLERRTRKRANGQVKFFWSLTEKGLDWGENLKSPKNDHETQPLYYIDKFEYLYDGLMN